MAKYGSSVVSKARQETIKCAYDFDGVFTEGYGQDDPKAIIITGRSYEEAPRTYKQLVKLTDKDVPVYFNPVRTANATMENSGLWKAEMIKDLNITDFYEDDPEQVKIIKDKVPSITIHLVKGKYGEHNYKS